MEKPLYRPVYIKFAYTCEDKRRRTLEDFRIGGGSNLPSAMEVSQKVYPTAIVNQKTSATAGKRKANPSATAEERVIRASVAQTKSARHEKNQRVGSRKALSFRKQKFIRNCGGPNLRSTCNGGQSKQNNFRFQQVFECIQRQQSSRLPKAFRGSN